MDFVSWSFFPRSTQGSGASVSCGVLHTGGVGWKKVAGGDVAYDAGTRCFPMHSFQPNSTWLYHRQDGKDPVTARFRSPFYLNTPGKHAVSLYPSCPYHLPFHSLLPLELSITLCAPKSTGTGFEMRRLFPWEEVCACGSLYSRFQHVIYTMHCQLTRSNVCHMGPKFCMSCSQSQLQNLEAQMVLWNHMNKGSGR